MRRWNFDCKGLPMLADDGEYIRYDDAVEHLKGANELDRKANLKLQKASSSQGLTFRWEGVMIAIRLTRQVGLWSAETEGMPISDTESRGIGKTIAEALRQLADSIEEQAIEYAEREFAKHAGVKP